MNFKMSEISKPSDVFWFYSNQIGYLRILLALISFYFMPKNPLISGFCYIISELLDAVDGHVARAFKQCSKFGAILDQLTDRCTFLGLLMCLSTFYPKFSLLFIIVAIIDISCHWIHVHSSLLLGKSSHKSGNTNRLLEIYYTNKTILFALCACNELFFVSLYLLNFFDSKAIYMLLILTGPLSIVKITISLVQGYEASKRIAEIDFQESKQLVSNK